MRRLSSFDAQFLAAETANTYGHYAALGILESHEGAPVPDGEAIIAMVQERIDRLRPLRWRLRGTPLNLDHPVFVEGEVDVAAHVYEHPVAEATDAVATLVAQQVLGERMDRSRPLWEIHVVVEPARRRGYLITKLHHAVADGLSAAVILATLCDDVPTGRVLPPPVAADDADPGQIELLARELFGAALHPLRALRIAPSTLPHLDQVAALRSLPGVSTVARGTSALRRLRSPDAPQPLSSTAPSTRMNGPLSPARRVAFVSLPLAPVKQLKRELGVTFNDVVMALVAGALRRRLSAGDELPSDPLLAFVPTNVRTEEENGGFGNAISSYVVPIPTDLDEASERVGAVHRTMTEAKARHESTPSTLLADANMLVPPSLFRFVAGGAMQLIASGRIAPPINVMISNVPGPPVPTYCCGARITAHHPLSLVMAGVGLNITVVSYDGQLDVGLVADRDLLPDVWELADDVVAELAELEALLPDAAPV